MTTIMTAMTTVQMMVIDQILVQNIPTPRIVLQLNQIVDQMIAKMNYIITLKRDY
jgi:hypothetical protein